MMRVRSVLQDSRYSQRDALEFEMLCDTQTPQAALTFFNTQLQEEADPKHAITLEKA